MAGLLSLLILISLYIYRYFSDKSREEYIEEVNETVNEFPVDAFMMPRYTRMDWDALFHRVGLGKKAGYLHTLLKPEIRLLPYPADERTLRPGSSKMGGLPDLPMGATWLHDDHDHPIPFLLQLNCEDMRQADTSARLPETGFLWFFGPVDVHDPEAANPMNFGVLYADCPASELFSLSPPENLPASSIFQPCNLSCVPALSLPILPEEQLEDYLPKDQMVQYYLLCESRGEVHKLLGYPQETHGAMELHCEVVTSGHEYHPASLKQDAAFEEIRRNAAQWQLLLQLDSSPTGTGMEWGDGGKLYFWIREADLARRDFSRVIAVTTF